MKYRIGIVALLIALFVPLWVKAQVYSNDFENRQEWDQPWLNLHIIADSSAMTENFVCICDSLHEYGLGFGLDKPFPNNNVNCKYGFRFKAMADTRANLVISIDDTVRNRYWVSYPLVDFVDIDSEWSEVQLDLVFPADYTNGSEIKGFVWNKNRETLLFDDARLEVNAILQPSYQPDIEAPPAISFKLLGNDIIPKLEYINAQGDTVNDPSLAYYDFQLDGEEGEKRITIKIRSTFYEDLRLLRLAFIWHLPEGQLTVYRRNQHIDTTDFQSAYYIDREGFSITNDSLRLCTYHNTGISSLQLDTKSHTVCFNIDYWRDHPLLHYPMRSDTSDYFQDISYREIKVGDTLEGEFNIYLNVPEDLPRLMPVWDGYQSAFIFSEHADWTDLRTHRAVLFGNEHITHPKDAVGGFCHFHIPVTKSVFYWNPDNITNAETSEGLFPGPIASIKTDNDFFKLLKTLKKEGFEICLHSPEIYTTIPSEFQTAMRFMKQQFGTVSWIDHGYNNGPDKNREDLVCDGLLPDSPQYAKELWKENGVHYLWNAYYEENRMEQYNFDSQLVQPYDGFGDALPNRQITTLPNGDKDFLLWSTSSTLEINEDFEWYYFFDSIRLQRLADQHNVFIAHTYPAWSNPYRAFWQYNENGTAVAMPGFNFALSQLARFRDEKKILPTTVEQYLSYYESLLKVDYQILDNHTISLTNQGEKIEGLTLLCTKPVVVEGKAIDFRKVDEGYLVWFDLGKNETVTIKHRE